MDQSQIEYYWGSLKESGDKWSCVVKQVHPKENLVYKMNYFYGWKIIFLQ